MGLHILCIDAGACSLQTFVVQPSELELETPYLKTYIEFTRKAYNLDAIQDTAYPALEDLTPEAIAKESRHDSKHPPLGFASFTCRPISRLKPYVSITSSTTSIRIATIWRTVITR